MIPRSRTDWLFTLTLIAFALYGLATAAQQLALLVGKA